MRSLTLAAVATASVLAWTYQGHAYTTNVASTSKRRLSDDEFQPSTALGYSTSSAPLLEYTSPLVSSQITIAHPKPAEDRGAAKAVLETSKQSPKKSTKSKRKRKHRIVRPRSLSSSPRVKAAKRSSKDKYPPLLSKEEEASLAYSLRTMRSAIRIRDELTKRNSIETGETETNCEPTEAEWADACNLSIIELRRVMHEGREARTKLVTANGGLVNMVARRHCRFQNGSNSPVGIGSILTFQDLVQEGNLGLMEAAERFEPERGNRFSTYAVYWVRQRILKAISEYSRVIRLPPNVHFMSRKVGRARRELETKLGRSPSSSDIADYLDIKVDKVQMCIDMPRSFLSLETPISSFNSFKDDDTRTLGELISSDSPTPQEDMQELIVRNDVREVVNELGPRERDVLVYRFGLDDGTSKTVEETARRMGISRDRVRLVEARALNKLRHPKHKSRLRDHIGGSSSNTETQEPRRPMHERSPEEIWSL